MINGRALLAQVAQAMLLAEIAMEGCHDFNGMVHASLQECSLVRRCELYMYCTFALRRSRSSSQIRASGFQMALVDSPAPSVVRSAKYLK
jgi:hypothetical protein